MTSINPLTDYRYLQVDESLLTPPPGSPISHEQFVQSRLMGLKEMEDWMVAAFSARKRLLDQLYSIGGIEVFKKKWKNVIGSDGHRAAAIMAQAGFETSKGMEKLGLTDMMTCAYEMSQRAEERKIKWPILGIVFPELSPWNLAPDSLKSEELFIIFERECHELVKPHSSSSAEEQNTSIPLDDSTVEAGTWKLFFHYGDLCSRPDRSESDLSLPIRVNNVLITANILRNAASRIFALGNFLALLVELATEKCAHCGVLGDTKTELKRCARCHCVVYCSRDCQSLDFKDGGHKKKCRKLATLKERYESDHPVPTRNMADTYLYLETFLYPKLRDAVVSTLREYILSKTKQAHPEAFESA